MMIRRLESLVQELCIWASMQGDSCCICDSNVIADHARCSGILTQIVISGDVLRKILLSTA